MVIRTFYSRRPHTVNNRVVCLGFRKGAVEMRLKIKLISSIFNLAWRGVGTMK